MDFHKEIQNIINQSRYQSASSIHSGETAILLEEFQKSLRKSDKRQMEMSLILEEMAEKIQEMSEAAEEKENIINDSWQQTQLLLPLIDTIEDFCVMFSSNADAIISSQAEILWNTILKKLSALGLIRIFDEKTPSDITLNTIVGTEHDEELPQGYIIRTMRSGYLYHQKVLRKSEVIVNKL